MIRNLAALVFLSLSVVSPALEPGFYPAFDSQEKPGFDELSKLSDTADREIWMDREGKYDLFLGKITDGARHPIELEFSEISFFLQHERHKDLLVVWFDKSIMWNEKDFITKRAREVTGRLRELGYRRIVILGAAGSGMHYVADTGLAEKPAAPPVVSGLAWHEFDINDPDSTKISIDGSDITIHRRDVADAAFKEDHLILKISSREERKDESWFTSSYGTGAIAVRGNRLFLRYGVGRGTFAREEFVRVFTITPTHKLDQVADVKVSTYTDVPGSEAADPVRVEYRMEFNAAPEATTLRFVPPSIPGVRLPETSLRIQGAGEN